MATTLVFTGLNANGHKALRALEDIALKALAAGDITVTNNGQPSHVQEATTSHGHVVGHPTDPKQDKHTPHTGGRKHDAPVSVTFA